MRKQVEESTAAESARRATRRGRIDANTVKPLSKNPGALHWAGDPGPQIFKLDHYPPLTPQLRSCFYRTAVAG